MSEPGIGDVFDGRYRLDGVLGEGGMGTVFAATQLSIGRSVAVKVMKAGLEASDRHVRRFRREAGAAGKLMHPHTVRTYDFGVTDDGIPYLVTERLRGHTLADRLRRGPLPAAKAITIASEVLLSLTEAHRVGLVHRDVKPANVFLADIGSVRDFVKVLDFGMVKLTTGTDQLGKVTRTGIVGGTPAYTSPENAMDQDIDARSDLYSVGVMLYEMVSGRLPFERGSSFETLLAHVRDPVPRLNAAVPAGLAQVVYWCLEKSPDLRPQSAEALREALLVSDASAPNLLARPSGRPAATPAATETESAEVPVSAAATILLDQPPVERAPIEGTTELVNVRRGPWAWVSMALWSAAVAAAVGVLFLLARSC